METQKDNIILYTTEDSKIKIELTVFDETVWLTQKEIAELFQKSDSTIKEHIKNIYDEGECAIDATSRKFRLVQNEGGREVTRQVLSYNLDLVLAVGYRVRSHRGTQFRQWATTTLKEYLVKGFAINDEKLKDPKAGDYFDELIERIRDIRASEKRIYQKIKDIYKLSVDYDKDSSKTTAFFKKVQNKTTYAITGHTAAEIVHARADHNEPNMGLTSWTGTKVRKADVAIAKNYLREPEIKELNRIVVMYLDHAEDMAKRKRLIHMKDWEEKLDAFLKFNERDLLQDAGKVSAEVAKNLAELEYQKFSQRRIQEEKEKDDTETLEEIMAVTKSLEKKDD